MHSPSSAQLLLPLLACQVAKLPVWHSTLTVRALLIAAVLGATFSIMSLKLGLTTGGDCSDGAQGVDCSHGSLRTQCWCWLPPPPSHPLFLSPTHARMLFLSAVIPSLNVAAGLLGYSFLGVLSKFLRVLKIGGKPVTPQEVTVIQTCVVACYGELRGQCQVGGWWCWWWAPCTEFCM